MNCLISVKLAIIHTAESADGWFDGRLTKHYYFVMNGLMYEYIYIYVCVEIYMVNPSQNTKTIFQVCGELEPRWTQLNPDEPRSTQMNPWIFNDGFTGASQFHGPLRLQGSVALCHLRRNVATHEALPKLWIVVVNSCQLTSTIGYWVI